jgi:hypothetical protein
MAQAIALTDLDWMADAHNVLVEVAALGRPFTAYTLTEAGLREPPHKNCWGKLFRDAADAGHIRRAWPNYVPSPRPARKGGVCAQWKAAA